MRVPGAPSDFSSAWKRGYDQTSHRNIVMLVIFTKQAKIRVSESFLGYNFSLSVNLRPARLAIETPKVERMSRIVGRERLQPHIALCSSVVSSLVPRTFVETIASAFGLAPPSGSSVCAHCLYV